MKTFLSFLVGVFGGMIAGCMLNILASCATPELRELYENNKIE